MMTKLVNNLDKKANFWNLNPHLTVVGGFKEFYQKDTSKDKGYSSKIMTAISYLLEVNESMNPWGRLQEDDRRNMISKDIINDKKFKWEDIVELEELYKELMLSQAERSLLEWNQYMEKRTKMIKEIELTLDNIKKVDDLMANNIKLYADYKKIQNDLVGDKTVSRNKGGGQSSATDEGLL